MLFLTNSLPSPDVYELEYAFWPWGQVITHLRDWIIGHTVKSGRVVDYMCGTGFLLQEVKRLRPDLSVCGCDVNESYISYGASKYPLVCLETRDALQFSPAFPQDVIVCSAGLHHLPYDQQPAFLDKIAAEMTPTSTLLLAEEVIRDNSSAESRTRSVVELNDWLMSHCQSHSAPESLLKALAALRECDLREEGEYKRTLVDITDMLKERFSIDQCTQIAPRECAAFGDYVFICRRAATSLL